MTSVGEVALLTNELAQRRRVDVIANNVANANTAGFKREQTLFTSYVREMKDVQAQDKKNSYQVLDHGLIRDQTLGAFKSTGNPLDVMIEGRGVFAIQLSGGQRVYTRQGHIQIAPNGDLELLGGKLLGADGQPLNIPQENWQSLSIGTDGSLLVNGAVQGRIQLYDGRPLATDPAGHGLLAIADAQPLDQNLTRLRTGGIEDSNVSTVVESSSLIEASRQYQSSRQMSSDLADLRRKSNERLGRAQF